MFADILQFPIETVDADETGTLGCAIAVAAAVGDYPTLSDAAAHMSSISSTVEPNISLKSIYDKKYALYQKTIACLDPLWPAMQDLMSAN